MLLTFPPELLLEIISNLSTPSLASVSLTCWHLHRVAQPSLYRTPSIHNTTSLNSNSLPHSPVKLLLRTLLSPDTAHLGLQTRTLSILWTTLAPTSLSESSILTAGGACVDLPHSVQPTTEVIDLCTLLPNLQTLILAPHLDCYAFSLFLKCRDRTSPFLSKLRIFRQHPDALRRCLHAPIFFGLLRLPSLRTLDARINYTPSTLSAAPQPPGKASITSLTLQHSDITPVGLHEILLLPAALSELSFTAQLSDQAATIADYIFPAAVQATLTVLHIEMSLLSARRSPPKTKLQSLRDWPALRTLRCSLACLLGVPEAGKLAEALPAGLTVLEVIEDRWWTGKAKVGKLVEMLQEKETLVSGLRRLVMSVGRAEEVLRAACEAVGVVLVVRVVSGVPMRPPSRRVKFQSCRRGPRA